MRRILVVLLLSACALAQTNSAPGGQTSSLNQNENAQKAKALLEQCIQAMGGDAWLNVRDYEQEGRTYSYNNGSPTGMGTVFWRYWRFPDKERIEFTKQRDIAYVYNGDKGYEITFKGTSSMEPLDLKQYLRRRDHSLETVLRIWLPDPKTALFYDGPAIAEQKHTQSVTLLNANNDSVTLFLDDNTHLPVKKQFEYRAADRLKDTETEVYDNWRPEGGIQTPHSILRGHNGEIVNQRFIGVVRYNTGVSEQKFDARVTYEPKSRPSRPE